MEKLEGWPTIAPLFWQHGEPHEVLRQEIRAMHGAGIRAFIVESRPHPDFCGPRWWSDLDAILAEAKSLGMRVWIFDDASYPTGFAGGAIRDSFPERRKRFLRRDTIEAAGPLAGASFRLAAWCAPGEAILAVVAGRLESDQERLDPASLVELTPLARDGLLCWDVPDGRWRVFVVVATMRGGEEWTKDHLNPIDPAAVRVLIDAVYEPHHRHYSAEFGRTIAGFFSDEPRFGNVGSYDARIGRLAMVLPYREGLLEELSRGWAGGFAAALPALWEDAGELSARARLRYMDTVSRLYAEAFSRQIGDWCRDHGVRYIGHVVEDNGAHARLGYGAGHFFRALSGQDASGFDMVYQVWPDHARGRFLTPFGDLDARFFNWGIAKLASSAAHLDPRKGGATACELFGAYGWRLGLRMMKWLTDHACVRGANLLIAHAFSPKEFPDPDCPPHFFARGNNPQWRHFGQWSRYADRVCGLLSGGDHVATAAVLYHAEAEWAGDCEPFECVVEELALRQVDCDVVPADALVDPSAAVPGVDGLRINRERYRLVVVPRAELLPLRVLQRLREVAEAGVRVVFRGALPRGSIEGGSESVEAIRQLRRQRRVAVLQSGLLVPRIRRWRLHEIEVVPAQPHLRIYHYSAGRDLWFLVNEDIRQPVGATVLLLGCSPPLAAYDAMSDRAIDVPHRRTARGTAVSVRLGPFGSLFLVAPGDELLQHAGRREPPDHLLEALAVPGPWDVSASTAAEYPAFRPVPLITGPGNAAAPGLLPSFSGTLRYRTTFEHTASAPGERTRRAWLDLGEAFETVEVWLNGTPLGVRICPPYRFEVGPLVRAGSNELVVEVTNTLGKALGDNGLDRAMPQDPTGLIGPVRLLVER